MINEKLTKNLKCPVCGGGLELSELGKSLLCTGGVKRHCFDIAASGYVNFAGSSGGDSKEAVRARRAFLSLGHYAPAAEKTAELIAKYAQGTVADAGCGEGYYSEFIANTGVDVLGFDLSRPAVEAASKRKIPNAFFAVAGINAMPVKDGSLGGITNIFAPCFEEEYTRALATGGALVLVGAGPLHLMGLKKALYDETPENTERADLPSGLRLAEKARVSYEIELDSKDDIAALFSMTPYYYKTSRDAAERLSRLDHLKTQAEFDFYVFIKE